MQNMTAFHDSFPPAGREAVGILPTRSGLVAPLNLRWVGRGVLTPPAATRTPRNLGGALRTARPTWGTPLGWPVLVHP